MTKTGTTPEQGDILLIPVPFTDLSSQKRRPVIVISNASYNRACPGTYPPAIGNGDRAVVALSEASISLNCYALDC
jgi:hypothetical protein